MPPKPPLDDNTRFLWQCLFHSDYKNIEFPGVAKYFGLNTPAARMRFSRLKKQLEMEAADDGEEWPSRREPVVQPRKRKRAKKNDESAGNVKKERGEDGDGEGEETKVKVEKMEGGGGVESAGAGTGAEEATKVKKEVEEEVRVKPEPDMEVGLR